jgi:hypothetical protein
VNALDNFPRDWYFRTERLAGLSGPGLTRPATRGNHTQRRKNDGWVRIRKADSEQEGAPEEDRPEEDREVRIRIAPPEAAGALGGRVKIG